MDAPRSKDLRQGSLHDRGLRYAIMDPTGNVTALVEDPVAVECQPEVAARIMDRHPEVEQVGFVSWDGADADCDGRLRMAGGEFCGNATMSAAALCLMRCPDKGTADDESKRVLMSVSGAVGPVEVALTPCGDASFEGAVRMPAPRSLDRIELAWDGMHDSLPLVRMEGISHLVIACESPFYQLVDDRPHAEAAVRAWCDQIGADGLGLMFLGQGSTIRPLAPLVFVPGSNTVFWESSCASGSAATGMWLAHERDAACSFDLVEPGGTLHVESDPKGATTWLHGQVKLVSRETLPSET